MLVSVGHENSVAIAKVVVISTPHSAPIKRLVAQARTNGVLIDLCAGAACRSVVFIQSGQVILSSNSPKILRQRFNGCSASPAQGIQNDAPWSGAIREARARAAGEAHNWDMADE